MYLLFVSQTSQCAAGLPVRDNPPRVLIRREEAYDAAWDHVANVGEDSPCLVHLSTNSHTFAVMLVQTIQLHFTPAGALKQHHERCHTPSPWPVHPPPIRHKATQHPG